LQLTGTPAFREGNVIDLGFTQLQVVDACSGIRYLFPLMVLSLLMAYWLRAHIWKRAFLFLSSIPIAVAVNAFRIAITGILYPVMGPRAAEGFFHDFSGWLIFMLTIPVLLLEMWILKRLPPREQGREGRREKKSNFVGPDQQETTYNEKRHFLHPAFVVAVILLAATAVLARTVEFREKVPISRPLNQLPGQIGEWSGKREVMNQSYLDLLTLSDYAMMNYTNGSGRTVNFYTAYYESQQKGQSIHSPETCLPGSGWAFNEAGPINVSIGNGKSMRINKAFIQKPGTKELTYYWFLMRGRVLTGLYQAKIYTFWDALTKHRTDGALVRLITPVYDNEKPQDAEARLQAFTREIVPVLKEYVPQ